MSEMLAEHTALADEEHQQLRLLVSKWQLLADLAFSDLVLWMPRPLPQRLLGSGADPADHRSDGAATPTSSGQRRRSGRPPVRRRRRTTCWAISSRSARAPGLDGRLPTSAGRSRRAVGKGCRPCRLVLAVRHPRRQWRLRYRVGIDHAVRDYVRVTSRSVAWIFGHGAASGI
jgi:hypothetical protein